MSGFLQLFTVDPYELFGAQVRRSRLALETAYNEAFSAWDRRADLLKEHQLNSGYGGVEVPWPSLIRVTPRELPQATLDRMRDEAVAENVLADNQASIVLLVADDAIQRFARGVLGDGRKPAGYGPEYGAPYLGLVKFTRLLRAGTNAVRHVSEWDDLPWDKYWPFPEKRQNVYPSLDDCKALEAELQREVDDLKCSDQRKPAALRLREIASMRRAMESIAIFQQVFGLGIGSRIRDPVSLNILTQVDGRLGHGTSYSRFEAAMLDAAHEIAAQRGPEGVTRYEIALE